MDGNVSLNYVIKSSEESEFYNKLSGISWSADYVKDNSSSQIYANINATSTDGTTPVILYSDGNNTYISFSSLSDKYLKLNGNRLSYLVSGNDVKTILKGINQAVDKVIADEKIYGNKENIDLDGKVLKTYKMRFVVDEKNRDRVVETFVNTLKANDELTKVLGVMKNMPASDIRTAMENYIPKIKKELKRCGKLEISLYVDNKTNDFIEMEITSTLGNINLISDGNNKFSYSMFDNNERTLSEGEFSFGVNNNKTKYTANLYYKKTKDNKLITESNFDLKFTSKKASSFKESDILDNVLNNQMTELEQFELYSKIITEPNFSKLLPLIEKMG